MLPNGSPGPSDNLEDNTPPIFDVHNVMYMIFDYLNDTTDLKNVSITCKALNRAVKDRLFRFMTLPGTAMGLRDPNYNMLKDLYPGGDSLRTSVFGLLSKAKSLTVSRRLIASATPFTAPNSLRKDWGIDDIELLGSCHEIYEATGKIISGTKELRHLEFHGFHLWLNVLKLLHMREVKEGFPGIQSIKITLPERQRHVLRVPEDGELHAKPLVPKMSLILITYFKNAVQVDENLKVNMSMVLGLKYHVIPNLSFRCLTFLALHGLQPDRSARSFSTSPCLLPLVLLLKSAEQLRCLEISTVNERVWGAYSDHDELPSVPPDSRIGPNRKARSQEGGEMMRMLCHAYKSAGGSPLQHLRYLRLGPGCLLESPSFGKSPLDDFPHHYLSYLFKLSGLVELHLEYPLLGDETSLQFVISAARLLINRSNLPRLRKLSLPYNVWYWWGPYGGPYGADWTLGYTVEQALTMRVVRYATDYGPCPLGLLTLPPLSGLILPTEHMDLLDIMSMLVLLRIDNLRSVKLMLPSLCEAEVGRCISHYGKYPRFIDRIPRGQPLHHKYTMVLLLENHEDVRNVWLAGDFEGKANDNIYHAMDWPCYRYRQMIRHTYLHHNAEMERAAMTFFKHLHKLEYIRILHRAWRRERKERKNSSHHDDSEKGSAPTKQKALVGPPSPPIPIMPCEDVWSEVRELTPWEVENDIPEAFDYRTPSLFRGRQYS
ncbi:hypothetical protein B0T09DRAFT_298434 [Sordaria sp. MPI-SDFR-AT-0083]|nr:hypothetical protein B0T09DRAFT_298434 [Sordaria sp. MPI-SDFR-AT-0083]